MTPLGHLIRFSVEIAATIVAQRSIRQGVSACLKKIDAAVALMMATGRAMIAEDPNAGLDGFLSRPLFA